MTETNLSPEGASSHTELRQLILKTAKETPDLPEWFVVRQLWEQTQVSRSIIGSLMYRLSEDNHLVNKGGGLSITDEGILAIDALASSLPSDCLQSPASNHSIEAVVANTNGEPNTAAGG